MGVQLLTYTRAIDVIVTPSPDAVDIPNPALFTVSGTNIDYTAFGIKSSVDFMKYGVRPGDIIYNITSSKAAYVLGYYDPPSPNSLILSADIFLAGGESFEVYQGAQNDASKNGCVIMTTSFSEITVVTLGGDTVFFAGILGGTILPVQVRQVIGNSGTQLIALW